VRFIEKRLKEGLDPGPNRTRRVRQRTFFFLSRANAQWY